jgi:hypothetical protein
MLTPEEKEIARVGKEQGKTSEQVLSAISKYRESNAGTTQKENGGFVETAKDFGIGFAKGIGSTVQGTGRAIQKGVSSLGQAAFGENNPYVSGESIFDRDMKASNTAQKVGKSAEFLAEVLFPTGLASTATKVGGATLKGLGSRLSTIGDDVVEGGVKVKDKLVDAITNLDDKTKTALSRTSKDVFDKYVTIGRNAMLDDRNRTPLEMVGDNVINSLKSVKDSLNSIAVKKQKILESMSKDTTLDLRASNLKTGDLFVPNEMGSALNKSLKNLGAKFEKLDLDSGDKSLVNSFVKELQSLGQNPSLAQIDRKIDMLQGKLYTTSRNSAVEVTDKVTGLLRQTLGELNSILKTKVGGEYSKLNDEYSETITFVNELNARLGKEGASAGSLVKRLFSPSDARTKELFDLLEKKTGQDFFRDARLAKFIMEVLGDTRAASLLEQVPTSGRGLVEKGIEYVAKKITDPIKSAERFIKNNLAK